MESLQPRAILFDLGSTLVEYEAVSWEDLSRQCAAGARHFLVDEGIDVPDEQRFMEMFSEVRAKYRRVAAESLVEWNVIQLAGELLNGFGVEFSDGLLDRFFDAYYTPVHTQLFVYDDVVDSLARLSEKYPVMGLVSNTVFPERVHQAELERFGIKRFLSFTLFSSTFGLRKPHPDIFYKAANLAGFAPSECVYVGDRYVEDIRGPNAIGMPAVLRVNPAVAYPADMSASVRRISTLSELANHIEI